MGHSPVKATCPWTTLFLVKKVLGLLNYELSLPKIMKIYLVFYTSLLELALLDVPLETRLVIDLN